MSDRRLTKGRRNPDRRRIPALSGSIQKGFADGFLLAHVIEHPDAARKVLHRQHELVLAERKPDRLYQLRDHQAGALKGRNPERFSNRLSLGRIEVDSPNVEKAPTARNEVNRLAIGRPARFIVPILAFGNRESKARPLRVSHIVWIQPPWVSFWMLQRQSIGRRERSSSDKHRKADRK